MAECVTRHVRQREKKEPCGSLRERNAPVSVTVEQPAGQGYDRCYGADGRHGIHKSPKEWQKVNPYFHTASKQQLSAEPLHSEPTWGWIQQHPSMLLHWPPI